MSILHSSAVSSKNNAEPSLLGLHIPAVYFGLHSQSVHHSTGFQKGGWCSGGPTELNLPYSGV